MPVATQAVAPLDRPRNRGIIHMMSCQPRSVPAAIKISAPHPVVSPAIPPVNRHGSKTLVFGYYPGNKEGHIPTRSAERGSDEIK